MHRKLRRAKRRTQALIKTHRYFLTDDLLILPDEYAGVRCSFPACSSCCVELAKYPEFHSALTLTDLERLQTAVGLPARELIIPPLKHNDHRFILKIPHDHCQFRREDGGCGLHAMKARLPDQPHPTNSPDTPESETMPALPVKSPFAPIVRQLESPEDPRPFMCKIFPYHLVPRLLDGVVRVTGPNGTIEPLPSHSEEFTSAYRAMVEHSDPLIFLWVDWTEPLLATSTLCTQIGHGVPVTETERRVFIQKLLPYWEAWTADMYRTTWFIAHIEKNAATAQLEGAFAEHGIEW